VFYVHPNSPVPHHYPGRRNLPPRAVKTDHPLSQICHAFYPGADVYQHVIPVELTELLAKIDQDHPEGQRFIVVSRQSHSSRGAYQTTLMDEKTRIFYRAHHPTGISTLLKGIARRRAGVVFLRPSEHYFLPGTEPKRLDE